jgi:hypothetical protein
MSVYVERPNMDSYTVEDGVHYQTRDGWLHIFNEEGTRILTYTPGSWVAVQLNEDEE